MLHRVQQKMRWIRSREVQPEQLPEPGPILDATLQSGTWMVRRKDVVRFATERELRRSHSFDFFVPNCLVTPWSKSTVVPLGFWWKAHDRYHDITLVDDTDRSLPLPRQDYNFRLTLSVMYEYARRILDYKHARELPLDVLLSIAAVVSGDPPFAVKLVSNDWYGAVSEPLATLAEDADFLQLLGICAFASLLTTTIQNSGRHHLVKLEYSEQQTSYFETDRYESENKPRGSIKARIRRWIPRVFGLGVYKLYVANAFVSSQAYNIDAYAPPGLQFAEASLRAGDECKNQSAWSTVSTCMLQISKRVRSPR